MDKEQAILRIKTSRQKLLQAVVGLSDAECCTVRVEGLWTVKDVIGHICAWDTSLTQPLHNYLQDGEFAPEAIPDHDTWNAHQAAKRARAPFDQVLKEAESVRHELIDLADRLAAEDWERILPVPWGGRETVAQMIAGLAWHEKEHTKSITRLNQSGTMRK
jgi:hypothetical protein